MSKILEKINLAMITRVTVYDEKEIKHKPYNVYPLRNFWGIKIGYIRRFKLTYYEDEYITYEQALKKYNIKNGILYSRPEIRITLASQEIITYTSIDLKDALDFVEELETKCGRKFHIYQDFRNG